MPTPTSKPPPSEDDRQNQDQPPGSLAWKPPSLPCRQPVIGRYGRLEPLTIGVHAEALFAEFQKHPVGTGWTYLPYGSFSQLTAFETWMAATCLADEPMFFAIIDGATDQATGMASFLNIDPQSGSIEVGHIHYSEALQRTRLATEAMFLMMRQVFEGGYRRYEWKCDSLNRPSRAAAIRYGFSFEGIFRQHRVVRNRNRDTAWYASVDHEWPRLKVAYDTWLDPRNFDEHGRQHTRLSDLTRPILFKTDG